MSTLTSDIYWRMIPFFPFFFNFSSRGHSLLLRDHYFAVRKKILRKMDSWIRLVNKKISINLNKFDENIHRDIYAIGTSFHCLL